MFGQYLVQEGYISELQLLEALEEQRIRSVPIGQLAIADAGKVVAVTGSVCGSAIIYLFPATMWFATEVRVPLRLLGSKVRVRCTTAVLCVSAIKRSVRSRPRGVARETP